MVSPEMDPTICWMFEAEIVLLFHAKTFHKGFQVTVHIGNVRQTATVEAVYDKVSSTTWACYIPPCYFMPDDSYILFILNAVSLSSYSYDASLYCRRS